MISLKYENKYNEYINHYKKVHVDPWHEISEDELNAIYNDLINKMDVTDRCSFYYLMNYIIKRLSGEIDAHTQYDVRDFLPINFKMFDNEILVNYPDNLKGSRLLSINGIDIDKIINELDEIITYGTKGKKIIEIEKALFNRTCLFSLPSLRNAYKLEFQIQTVDNEIKTLAFSKDIDYQNQMFNWFNYTYNEKNNFTYKIEGNTLIYTISSFQNYYYDKLMESLENLNNEDLSRVNKIILDIRGNKGGNGEIFTPPLYNFISKNIDKDIVVLTDRYVFSAARSFLTRLKNEYGAVTIGDEIATPLNAFGNSNWYNHYFSSSEWYIHPILDVYFTNKEEYEAAKNEDMLKPIFFEPDIYLVQTKEDYLNNIDTVLNFVLEHSKERKK